MADLKEFLAGLATDPKRLGEFIRDPDALIAEAGLSDEDTIALKSGFPGLIHARLAGVSLEEAFNVTLRPPVSPQQFVFPVQMQQVIPQPQFPQQLQQLFPQPQFPQLQLQFPQQLQQLFPQPQFPQLQPQFPQLPPQFIYQQLPPQFIYQQLPPQFIYQQISPQQGLQWR